MLNSLDSLLSICNDIDEWPRSWAGDQEDMLVGDKLLPVFKSYLIHILEKGRSRATIRKHSDYLWALGGEIVRDITEHGTDAKLSNVDLVLQYIHCDGGPYWRHANSESDYRQFDATCRQLFKFLSRQ